MSLFGLETTVNKRGKKLLKLNMCISVKLINGSTTRMLWRIFRRCHTGPLLISKVLRVSRELRYRSYFEGIKITEELLFTSQQVLEKSFIKRKYPANIIYLFKFNNNNKKILEKSVKYVQSQQWRQQNNVVLVSLLLTLNIFYTFFQCLYCGLWAGKCLLGRVWESSLSEHH